MQGTKRVQTEEELKASETTPVSEHIAVNFLIWVRLEDYYYVKKQKRWFNAKGELLTEEQLFDKYLNE